MARIFKNSDVLSGAALAALGIYIMTQALSWEYFGPDGPGPGFFPFWYGVAMTSLALVLMVITVRQIPNGPAATR